MFTSTCCLLEQVTLIYTTVIQSNLLPASCVFLLFERTNCIHTAELLWPHVVWPALNMVRSDLDCIPPVTGCPCDQSCPLVIGSLRPHGNSSLSRALLALLHHLYTFQLWHLLFPTSSSLWLLCFLLHVWMRIPRVVLCFDMGLDSLTVVLFPMQDDCFIYWNSPCTVLWLAYCKWYSC